MQRERPRTRTLNHRHPSAAVILCQVGLFPNVHAVVIPLDRDVENLLDQVTRDNIVDVEEQGARLDAVAAQLSHGEPRTCELKIPKLKRYQNDYKSGYG